jgi:hypothetical protein
VGKHQANTQGDQGEREQDGDEPGEDAKEDFHGYSYLVVRN